MQHWKKLLKVGGIVGGISSGGAFQVLGEQYCS